MKPLACLWLLAFPAGASALSPQADEALRSGLDHIFSMRYDEAEADARRALALEPEHPYPRLGLAAIAWSRYLYENDRSDALQLAGFQDKVGEAVAAGADWLSKHPNDPEGLLALGASYGLSSRLLLMRREWVRAYWHGRKALQNVRAAAKADPELWDAQLGIAMYDYYTDLYPRFVGVLARLVLRGDRKRAIANLTKVAEKGHFARVAAKALLIEIYTEDPYGAKDPAKALALARELRAQYPDSAVMHWAELLSLYSAGLHEEAAAGAKDYLGRVESGLYRPIEKAKGSVILGLSEWALGRHDEALSALWAAAQVQHAGRPSRWAVWASIRAAELEDSLGRRAEAIEDYRLALAQPDAWGFHRLAKAGLSKPYALRLPGPVTPP